MLIIFLLNPLQHNNYDLLFWASPLNFLSPHTTSEIYLLIGYPKTTSLSRENVYMWISLLPGQDSPYTIWQTPHFWHSVKICALRLIWSSNLGHTWAPNPVFHYFPMSGIVVLHFFSYLNANMKIIMKPLGNSFVPLQCSNNVEDVLLFQYSWQCICIIFFINMFTEN